jgi:hypothetical protein
VVIGLDDTVEWRWGAKIKCFRIPFFHCVVEGTHQGSVALRGLPPGSGGCSTHSTSPSSCSSWRVRRLSDCSRGRAHLDALAALCSPGSPTGSGARRR